MFITLLGVTFLIAFLVSSIVVGIFKVPIASILDRIIADEISRAWAKYINFAMYVTGISSGVNIWKVEQYVTAKHDKIIELTKSRWLLEIYRTIIGSLQGMAWMLLVFFVFALIAFVIVRVFELRQKPAS